MDTTTRTTGYADLDVASRSDLAVLEVGHTGKLVCLNHGEQYDYIESVSLATRRVWLHLHPDHTYVRCEDCAGIASDVDSASIRP